MQAATNTQRQRRQRNAASICPGTPTPMITQAYACDLADDEQTYSLGRPHQIGACVLANHDFAREPTRGKSAWRSGEPAQGYEHG